MTVIQEEASLLISDVSVDFGGLHALGDVSATARPGKILGIVGPNGAGKTTLFNVVSGVVRATQGSIRLNGVDITRMPTHLRARQGLSRTFQNLALNDEMTVLENVLTGTQRLVPDQLWRLTWEAVSGASFRRERDARGRALRVIESLALLPDVDRLVSELPFGTRRRVDMARALCGSPAALLLDEPFSGLGERERPLMADTIRAIREGGEVAIVLVEHDMAIVSELCDELVVLNEGVVIGTGSPVEMLADPVVQEAYLGPKLSRRRRTTS